MRRHVATPQISLFENLTQALEKKDQTLFLSCITAENCNMPLDAKGTRPLHMACCLPSTTAITSLLALGTDPNAAGDMGAALHTAVVLGHVFAFPILIGAPSFDPYVMDKEQRTALRVACESMARRAPDGVVGVWHLLHNGIPEDSLGEGLNVAFFAHMNGSDEAREMLVAMKLNPQIGHISIGDVLRFRHVALLRRYQEELGDETCFARVAAYRNRDGASALHELCLCDQDLPMLQILGEMAKLDHTGWQSFLEAEDARGYRPLHYAAEKNAVSVIQLLIRLRAKTQASHVPSPIEVALDSGAYNAFVMLRQHTDTPDLANRWEQAWQRVSNLLLRCLPNYAEALPIELEKKETSKIMRVRLLLALHTLSPEQGTQAIALLGILDGLQKIKKEIG